MTKNEMTNLTMKNSSVGLTHPLPLPQVD